MRRELAYGSGAATHVAPPPPASAPDAEPSPRALLATVPGAAPAAGTSDSDPWYATYLGRTPPELPTDGTWVKGGSASLAGLRGRVVLLHFAFSTCGGCKPLLPFLEGWHRSYASKGLEIVFLDNGGMDDLATARATAEALPGYRFFHDAKARAVLAYGVRAFPIAYVVGRDGRVVWEGPPGAVEAKVEDAIVAALAR
jgi:thiol-disulfide isomerase/thioredoxin